jgi:ribosomal protein L7/L12
LNDDDIRALAQRLDYVERYLVNLGQVAGHGYVPYELGVAASATPELAELARLGQTGDAIKLYRKLTGASFEQAKYVVDQMQAGGFGQQAAGQPSFASDAPAFTDDIASFGPAPASFGGQASFGGGQGQPFGPAGSSSAMAGASGFGVPDDIVAVARAGNVIAAIKQYRDRSGVSLRDAKAAVEQAVRGY